jgi:hypothetical protein
LADCLKCSERQIDKWVKSLRDKKLIRTGRRRNRDNKQWDNTVYNLKPLIDTVLNFIGEKPLPDVKDDYEIIWDDENNEPNEPEIRMDPSEPEVRMENAPEVRTKRKVKRTNKKDGWMKLQLTNGI